MALIIATSLIAFVSVYFGIYLEKGKGYGFWIFCFALATFILAYWQGIDAKNSEIEVKDRDIALLEEVIKSKDEIINQYKGNAENLVISTQPFYRGSETWYRFKIEVGPNDNLNDVVVKYFPPEQIKQSMRNGIMTEETFNFYKSENIGNLSHNGWQYFGEPFTLAFGESIYYRFHINTRKDMYWYTLVSYKGPEPFLLSARKLFRLEYYGTDTITDRKILQNMGKSESDTFFYKKSDFFPVDSFIPTGFPINVSNEQYFWDHNPE
ncbi:hypothetical protein GGR26_003525 [Lewinella marina]|uniref:Uncharacterized protein n=1 Tax=Neolewinella marina TaxID=438751 RepID=A0A2G0CB73_9BACT|nr:hypothetical protein [Neolewinella marina]NJB87739.1 hypothetical protein [Neolewinella marina]PHK97212.1 hypothetical protein CGL56_16660 [Neolewinella marina]